MQDSKLDELRNNECKLGHVNSTSLSSDPDKYLVRSNRAKVVVIGAGLAGLAAAQRLHESGVDDVIILDAQTRVGGRVHTINHSDYLLELGAQWLHGAEENPLYQWLTSLGMLDDFQDASLGFEGVFCTSSGTKEIIPRLVKKVLDIVCESKLALSKDEHYLEHLFANNPSRARTINMNDELLHCVNPSKRFKNAGQVFKSHLDMKIGGDGELVKNKQLVYTIFDWFLRYETIENGCDSMNDVSIQSYTDWTDLGEGTLLNFKHGYRSLLQWFCEHIPCERWLHLNKQALNVELLRESMVKTGNSNNTTSSKSCWIDSTGMEYDLPVLVKYRCVDRNQTAGTKIMTISCNHVIVTSSLGFLKNNMKTFFTPELPIMKQDLIKSIGFGTVNKIVLQFESPFWKRFGGIKLVWEETDFVGPDSFPLWCRDILAFDVVRRQPNLLIGWIGGQGAKSVENEQDDKIGEICLRILDRFLPKLHERPTKLLACLCSRWHSNPFICGSYSFQSMDSLGMNVDKLYEPLYSQSINGETIDREGALKEQSSLRSKNHPLGSHVNKIPRVMFAGEATAGKLYSTTHGAIISGWREADRLAEYLSPNEQSGISMQQSISNVGCHVRVQI